MMCACRTPFWIGVLLVDFPCTACCCESLRDFRVTNTCEEMTHVRGVDTTVVRTRCHCCTAAVHVRSVAIQLGMCLYHVSQL